MYIVGVFSILDLIGSVQTVTTELREFKSQIETMTSEYARLREIARDRPMMEEQISALRSQVRCVVYLSLFRLRADPCVAERCRDNCVTNSVRTFQTPMQRHWKRNALRWKPSSIRSPSG
jgi:hypothetical protein